MVGPLAFLVVASLIAATIGFSTSRLVKQRTAAVSPSLRFKSLQDAVGKHVRRIPPLTSTASGESSSAIDKDDILKADAVVCGGGPAGLLSAIMLAEKFPDFHIKVYDRLDEPPSPTDDAVWNDIAKFYLIGLGSRGEKALKTYDLWNDVTDAATQVVGRRDWSPQTNGTEIIFRDRPPTQVLPRDKLVGVLHKRIVEKYESNIELNYGYEVHPVHFGTKKDPVLLEISSCTADRSSVGPTAAKQAEILCDTSDVRKLSAKLLIAADGTARTIANRMERDDEEKYESKNAIQKTLFVRPFKIKRYPDDNQRIYKTIPIKLPSHWRGDLNYSARAKGARLVLDALPANDKGEMCGVLLLKKDDPLAKPDSDARELRRELDLAMPQISEIINDETLEIVAKKPPSYLPSFRYAGPRLNQGERTLILGDCAHTVKPYFGLGANSALEDVMVLGEIFDSTNKNITRAVLEFSDKRAIEARTLVRVSRDLDRPGKLGFATFILPLILDSIFFGLFPKYFEQNIIAVMQRSEYTFARAAARKRRDRVVQIGVICLATKISWEVASWFVRASAKAVGRKPSTVAMGLTIASVGLGLLQKYLTKSKLLPNFTPTVMSAKAKSKVRNSDTFLTPLGAQED